MTKDEAIKLVHDFAWVVRDLERADYTNRRYYLKEYEAQREKVITALTSAYHKGE